MFALNTLNVALGLVFTWTLLSMAAMYIQEWIAARRKWRARMLEKTVGNILTDPALLHQLYNHPLIQSLYSGNDGENKPSYIPAGQFAQALLDIIANAGHEASLLQQQLTKMQCELLGKGRRRDRQAQKQLGLILAMIRRALVDQPGSESAAAVLESVNNELLAFGNEHLWARPAINKALGNVAALKQEIAAQVAAGGKGRTLPPDSVGRRVLEGSVALGVTHPRLKQTLNALLMVIPDLAWESEMGMEQFRCNVEEWYNNSMTRLTGWYKRRAQAATLLIGLAIAFLLNADSLMLADRFWSEPFRTEDFAAEALAYVDGNPGAVETLTQSELDGLSNLRLALENIDLPLGWLAAPEPLVVDDGIPSCALFPVADGDRYGLQVGDQCYPFANTPQATDPTGWSLKMIGLLVTGLAVSQGAPFWFDILKKIVNIRFTGLNPAETARPVG